MPEKITSRHVKTVLKLHAEMLALWEAHASRTARLSLAAGALTGGQLALVTRLRAVNPYQAIVRVKVVEKGS